MPRNPRGGKVGRPRKPRPGDPGYVEPVAPVGDAPPSSGRRKRKTLEDFADMLADGREKYNAAILAGSDQIPNLRAYNQSILDEARMYGFGIENLIDRRPESAKIDEAIDRLIVSKEPETEIERATLESLEKELSARVAALEPLERAMGSAVRVVQEAEHDLVAPLELEALRARKREEGALRRGKAWLDVLRRTIRVQKMALEEEPSPETIAPFLKEWSGGIPEPDPRRTRHCIRASHVLRHMAYVLRTNISERQKAGGAAEYFDFQRHHGKSAIAYYMMEHGYRIGEDGFYDFKTHEGVIITMPPGLGKTTVGVSFFSLKIARNPYTKLIIGHAVEDLACKNVTYISSLFKADNPGGRRLRALYGPFEFKKDNDHEFKLKLPKESKESTVRGNAMVSKISGGDADWVWFDDPVDRTEREQEGERRRKYEMMNDNWLTRLRSKTAKHVTTTTLWHEDDANCRRIKGVKEGRLSIVVLVLAHGGPESTPNFHSLWPEEFPPSRLRSICARDPMSYSACYMSDPRTESMRLIRKIRLFAPESPEHAKFMRTAVVHISADPAATARQKSDRASLIDGAIGQVCITDDDGDHYETRLRITCARQIHATQSDLSRAIAERAVSGRADYCHVETVGGFVAMAEMLKDVYGIDCIQHTSGSKSKEVRLKQVAALIDHSVRGNTTGGAVVEFPGMWDSRLQKVVPDPEYQWLYDQFLKFGIIRDDHAVDAVVQLVGYLQRTGQLSHGQGWVSRQAIETMKRSDTAEAVKKLMGLGPREELSAPEEDDRFLKECGNGGL